MTFAEAAMAYELLQSGFTRRMIAPGFGVSRVHLGRVIRQCLELGRSAPLVNVDRPGRPRAVPIETVKRAMVLRGLRCSWSDAARTLGVDPERLRRSVWHYDNYHS